MSGAPHVLGRSALACTPDTMDPMTPPGDMHSVRCTESDETVYCVDPNLQNAPPALHRAIPAASAPVGLEFSMEIPVDTFLDRQADGRMTSDLLAYSIRHALSWLHFEPRRRIAYGVPAQAGTWPIIVTATDPGFREGLDPPLNTSTEFLLHIQEAAINPGVADFWVAVG